MFISSSFLYYKKESNMAQKVNPIAVRLGLNKKADSSWFSDYYYATLFLQDYHLRNSLNSLKQTSGNKLGLRTAKCVIHHYPKKSTIHLFCLGRARIAGSNYARDTYSTIFSLQNPVNSVLRNNKSVTQLSRNAATKPSEQHAAHCALHSTKHSQVGSLPALRASAAFFMSSGWTDITCNKVEKTVTIDSQNWLSNSPYPKTHKAGQTTLDIQQSSASRSVSRFGKFQKRSTAFLECNEFGAGNYTVMQYYEKKKTGQSLLKVRLIVNKQSAPKQLFLPVFELQTTYKSLPNGIKRMHYSLSHFQNVLCNYTNVLSSIKPIQVTSIYQSASLVAQEICFQLEQTKSFRQICKTILKEIEQRNYIKGIRIMCSGRLNGAEIAKTECKKYGETSLHVFSDQIDYAANQASTPYGILGVKVWISYLLPSSALRK